MKAVMIEEYGGPEVLRVAEVPAPKPKGDEIVIAVRATSVNPVDWLVRDGGAKSFVKLRFPAILGCDLAGEVAELGPEAKRFQVGDPVLAMMPDDFGAHAERVALSERLVVPKPKSISMVEAAALPVVAMTALRGLRAGVATKRGDRVLVNGASGGVGLSAIQIAKAMGAHVTAVASAASFELVTRVGADATVDYKTTDFRKGTARFDRVFDCVGTAPHSTCKDVLQGSKVHVTTIPGVGIFVRSFFNPLFAVKVYGLVTKGDGDDLGFLAALVDKGELRPVVDRVFPFADVAAAQAYSKAGRAKGKIVLVIA
jgi:NADPH:quinone reductase-like Zn-dependent oxidoreductase